MSLRRIERTKLHRPRVMPDVIERTQLLELLDSTQAHPVTLVSAPAGYGKTTLVSQWLARGAEKSAWLSLSERENSLSAFLEYVLAALKTLSLSGFERTSEQLRQSKLASTARLAATLVDDLLRVSTLDTPFILVLDDLHRVSSLEVMEFLDDLTSRQLPSFRLIIVCRHDPNLSLGTLRAAGNLLEIRLEELLFSTEEARQFLHGATTQELSPQQVNDLHQTVEGWPAGLRFAVISLLRPGAVSEKVRVFRKRAGHAIDYLRNEIVSGLDSEMQTWLVQCSLAEQLCSGLIEAICSGPPGSGRSLLDRSVRAGLTVFELDEEGRWFRFHQLLRDVLRQELIDGYPLIAIQAFHRRAADWFASEGLVDSALLHYLEADAGHHAATLVKRQKDQLFEQEDWIGLDELLSQLPETLRRSDADLLVLEAWVCERRGRHSKLDQLLTEAEKLSIDQSQSEAAWATGVTAAIRASQALTVDGDVDATYRQARLALDRIPPQWQAHRTFATTCLMGALSLQGRTREATAILHRDFEESSSETRRRMLMATLCWVHWMAGELEQVERIASATLARPSSNSFPDSTGYLQYFRGASVYYLGNIRDAKEAVRPVVDNVATPNLQNWLRCNYVFASALHAEGRSEAAWDHLSELSARVIHLDATSFLDEIDVFRAEMALRQGRMLEAAKLAKSVEVGQLGAGWGFFMPELTATKSILASGDFETGLTLIERLTTHLEQTHSVRFLIEALAVDAVFRNSAGDTDGAKDALERAFRLAHPAGFDRLFLDLGSGLAVLLQGLRLDTELMPTVRRILDAFRNGTGSTGRGQPHAKQYDLDPLTIRESQILTELTSNLTYKEIASKLYISPGTVKSHVNKILSKLAVGNRRAAVNKARALGILP